MNAEIVAEAGINEKVSPQVWDDARLALDRRHPRDRPASRRLHRRNENAAGAGAAFSLVRAGAGDLLTSSRDLMPCRNTA
jgi:hypothetical protein